jgi:hypothetical protein
VTDHYTWFDPHDTRDQLDRAEARLRAVHFQIANARQDGQEDILRKIVDAEKSPFWQAMKESLNCLAERTAREIVFPSVRNNYPAALEAARRIEQQLHALSRQVLTPMMTAPSPIGIQAFMAPANEQGDAGPRLVFQMPAFSFTQQLPPPREF